MGECNCNCLDGLRTRLQNKVGSFVGIYEKNGNAVFGTLVNVGNNIVKIGSLGPNSNPLKFLNPGCPLLQVADSYFISICEIAEFAINPDAPEHNNFCDITSSSQRSMTWNRKPN